MCVFWIGLEILIVHQMKSSCNCIIIENDFFGLLPLAVFPITLVKQFASL